MKKLLCLIGLAMLCLQINAQATTLQPFKVNDRIDDMPLKNILNYKDSVASLSSFGDKLIILDFWATWCTSCIRMFPLEDSLQALYGNDVQFLLVTDEPKEKIVSFLEKYNSRNKTPLTMPIVTNDKVLRKLFSFFALPHYVWIAPNGLILAQSSDVFITKENIANTLLPIRAEEARLQGNAHAAFNLYMQKPSAELLQIISSIEK